MEWNDRVTQLIDSSKLICIYEFCPGTGAAYLIDRQQVVFVYKNNDFADVYAYHSELFKNELSLAQLDLKQAGIDIEYSQSPSLEFYSRVLYPHGDLNKEFYTPLKQGLFKRLVNTLLFKVDYEINPLLSFYDTLAPMRIIRASEYDDCLELSIVPRIQANS